MLQYIRRVLARLFGFDRLEAQGEKIMLDLSVLIAQVKANTDAEAAAIVTIQALADALKASAADPAQVAALASQLQTSAAALGAAIVANTPAAPVAATPAT